MKTKGNETGQRAQRLNHVPTDGPNWFFIAGGALLSTISIRLCCKLKQGFYNKQQDNAMKESKNSIAKRTSGACELHSNVYHLKHDSDTCFHCLRGSSSGSVDVKQSKSLTSKDGCLSLPIVQACASESNKDNCGVVWATSPERLELPRKLFHHSNSSDSPCVSESGSDIYSKREVIQKLRQQLKRRDDMILEMQTQITDLQNSLNVQSAHLANLQAQIETTNRNLFESEREIQQLRKVIADHCVLDAVSPEKPTINWRTVATNGFANGYPDSVDDLDMHSVGFEKVKVDGEKVEMLKREVGELKEVVDGKDFLIQSYKEQKVELTTKIKELQLKLASQESNLL